MIKIIIRKAVAKDAESIAYVHVESWKSTYRRILSDATLSKLSPEKRAELWKTSLSDPHCQDIVYVAENAENRIAGFASGGPSRLHQSRYKGEIYAIYLLDRHQKRHRPAADAGGR
ncbi:hypothetical protein AAGG52_12090 [Bacillus licheniformis]